MRPGADHRDYKREDNPGKDQKRENEYYSVDQSSQILVPLPLP